MLKRCLWHLVGVCVVPITIVGWGFLVSFVVLLLPSLPGLVFFLSSGIS